MYIGGLSKLWKPASDTTTGEVRNAQHTHTYHVACPGHDDSAEDPVRTEQDALRVRDRILHVDLRPREDDRLAIGARGAGAEREKTNLVQSSCARAV